MKVELHCGDTVFMPQVRVAVPHLWIVATEPIVTTWEAILLNVTSLRPESDKTVVLDPRDHPFIVKPSAISFGDSLVIDIRQVAQGIELGYWPQRERCSALLMERIQSGIMRSTRTPEKIKRFFQALPSDPNRAATGG